MIEWFNYYGLIIMGLMMIPNIAFAITHKDKQPQVNKAIEIFEQIGRYGCFILMIFNIPFTYAGFYFERAELVYLVTNGILILNYLIIWMICWNKFYAFRSYALSILPTLIFIFSGVVLGYYLLFSFSIIFGVCHIYISIKDSKQYI